MPAVPLMKEDHISQIPALQLLQNLGWEYLTPDEANR
jgi:type I restriction enzyme R subunit